MRDTKTEERKVRVRSRTSHERQLIWQGPSVVLIQNHLNHRDHALVLAKCLVDAESDHKNDQLHTHITENSIAIIEVFGDYRNFLHERTERESSP
jgi:hypothetical protein